MYFKFSGALALEEKSHKVTFSWALKSVGMSWQRAPENKGIKGPENTNVLSQQEPFVVSGCEKWEITHRQVGQTVEALSPVSSLLSLLSKLRQLLNSDLFSESQSSFLPVAWFGAAELAQC